jgi:hypothetical protein
MAMIDALQRYQIDVVVLWSQVAETFSFTLHEALALVHSSLTNPQSGNIQDYFEGNPSSGLVLESVSAFLSSFESERSFKRVREPKRRQNQANLIIGGLRGDGFMIVFTMFITLNYHT